MSPVWHALLVAIEMAAWFAVIGGLVVGVVYGVTALQAWRKLPR